MALFSTEIEPIRSSDPLGWTVLMTDMIKNFRVLVTDKALEELVLSPDSGLDKLNRYRSTIEEIASTKLAAGMVEKDETICIRSTDMQ